MKDGPKSLSELEHEIEGITQKMLLEQLRELIQFGLVEKKTFEGYPLRVEYSITERRGRKMIEAITIMQMIGIDYMLEKGMSGTLIAKGILAEEEIKSMWNRRYAECISFEKTLELIGRKCGNIWN